MSSRREDGNREPVNERTSYPAETTSPGKARSDVRAALAKWRLESLTDTATLIVSELVTNAVRHGGTDVHLTLTRLDDGIRVEVGDGRPEIPPAPRRAAVDETNGRGMALVAACATSWGWDSDGQTKTVWAEITER